MAGRDTWPTCSAFTLVSWILVAAMALTRSQSSLWKAHSNSCLVISPFLLVLALSKRSSTCWCVRGHPIRLQASQSIQMDEQKSKIIPVRGVSLPEEAAELCRVDHAGVIVV